MPQVAKPADTPIIFASAIPTLKNLSGYAFLKGPVFIQFIRSASNNHDSTIVFSRVDKGLAINFSHFHIVSHNQSLSLPQNFLHCSSLIDIEWQPTPFPDTQSTPKPFTVSSTISEHLSFVSSAVFIAFSICSISLPFMRWVCRLNALDFRQAVQWNLYPTSYRRSAYRCCQ